MAPEDGFFLKIVLLHPYPPQDFQCGILPNRLGSLWCKRPEHKLMPLPPNLECQAISIGWIMFLLLLRGIALGLTAQTTMVASLSQVPMHDLPRGSSLNNATRNVVQSIGVAVLATVLASTLSPEVKELQAQLDNPGLGMGTKQTGGICGAAAAASDASSALAIVSQEPATTWSHEQVALLQQACQENVTGFERAYRLTFYASLVALVLGAFLPGWPLRWRGRQMTGAPVASH